MSQGDTGLFSVRRPRETLGAISYNSAIPQPASALKRSNSISGLKENLNAPHTTHHGRSASSSRMSLAPSRPQQPLFQRSSSGTNLADLGRPSTVQRTSSSNIFGGVASAPRMTYMSNTMTPHKQSSVLNGSQSLQRRSSVYSRPSSTGPMGHQSFFTQAPIPAGVPRDPRPLKDRSYQAKIGQEMLDYLTQNNFEMDMKHSLGQNTLKSPTQKDFNFIFQWLYHRIDPGYKFTRGIDAEVPPILKQLRYPFEKSITKSQLVAVGGQNWSTFLGMLHWMMQLAQMMDQYEAGDYDDACAEAGVDVSGDRIIFRFLSGAYRDWLQVDDDQDEEDADRILVPHVEAMAAEFERGNQRYAEEMKVLEAENESLRKQIDEAEAERPDIAKLDKFCDILNGDIKKFTEWNSSQEAKAEKYEYRNNRIVEEITKYTLELDDAERESSDLQASVDKQGITIQDIDRMNIERDRLQKSTESTIQKLEETKRRAAEKETEASYSLEEFERVVESYNNLCYRVGLIPSSAVNAKGKDFELHLATTTPIQPDFSASSSQQTQQPDRLLSDPLTGYSPTHLLNLPPRTTLKPLLLSLRKEISERRSLALEADIKNHELLDSIAEAIDDKQNEVETLEHRVRAAEEDFESVREGAQTQKVASDAQIERMEKELGRMKRGVGESLEEVERREMAVGIEYEQLTLRANALREELHTEIEKMLNDIIKFKVHVQKSLEDYEGFVVEEVESELGGDGDGESIGVAVDGGGGGGDDGSGGAVGRVV
ncbi:MAG: hypothetical protein L6R40_001848 [Gallowayella cf. fulva]|nr:MAG: hypothetical protein L6R40_001848 [Xanthomendoza cf. fulva]